MTRVHILVEGPTEYQFVGQVLGPHMETQGVYLNSVILKTKVVASGPDFRGGILSYARVRKQTLNLLGDTSAAMVTTMLDFYGLRQDFPGYTEIPGGSCYEKIEHLETAFEEDVDNRRFSAYFSLHEFEALLFADPDSIGEIMDSDGRLLRRIRNEFGTPEEINEENPPARRLKSLFAGYQKALHGPLISKRIGLEQIREACPHFDQWVGRIESLGRE